MTHEIYESDSFFPNAQIEYYYYDQLGSYYSDQPEDLSLWDLDRFVEEVEQVRVALNLDSSNLFVWTIMGWDSGNAICLKYQQNLKGLIVSNMVPSIRLSKYSDNVLAPKLDPDVLKEIMKYEKLEDYSNPRYMELLMIIITQNT